VPVAQAINASLAACGAPLCRGGVMAGNPAWCLSVDEWRQRFSRWLDEPQPAALLHAAIFFDLRGVHGNQELARGLRSWLCQAVPRNRRFLALLTRNALERQPPLGLFRDFVVDVEGENRGTFDLKQEAANVFVEAARILALAAGSSATGTEARLRDAGDRGGVERRETQAWVEAFHFVQALRLKLQCEQADRGGAPHNRVDPGELNALDRRFLVEALRQAQKLQKRLARVHGAEAAGL
jgi:CBS domain-containing protein